MSLRTAILAAGLAAVVAVGAFFGVRFAVAQFSADAEEGKPIPKSVHEEVEREMNKEPFVGEILGIYVAPSEDQVPDGFDTVEDICPDLDKVQWTPYSAEDAGMLALDFTPPAGYELKPDDPDTAASLCEGVPFSARRYYDVTPSNGLAAHVRIGRSVFRQTVSIKAAPERVYAADIGGRPAVVIEPVAIEGLPEAQNSVSAVYFPEPFGVTFVLAFQLPKDDLLALAETVADATHK